MLPHIVPGLARVAWTRGIPRVEILVLTLLHLQPPGHTHIDAENRKEENADAKKSGPPSWLLQLPTTFNYDQLVALRKAKGASTEPKAVKHLLAVWKNKQLITEQLNPDGTVTYTKL